jgi:hypothetical protein
MGTQLCSHARVHKDERINLGGNREQAPATVSAWKENSLPSNTFNEAQNWEQAKRIFSRQKQYRCTLYGNESIGGKANLGKTNLAGCTVLARPQIRNAKSLCWLSRSPRREKKNPGRRRYEQRKEKRIYSTKHQDKPQIQNKIEINRGDQHM